MTPKITIDGVEYSAKQPPRAGLWRKHLRFQKMIQDGEKNPENADEDKMLDSLYSLIAETFETPEVTAETVERDLALPDVMPKYHEIKLWINALANGKAAEMPAGDTKNE